jgi:hypothetical protein
VTSSKPFEVVVAALKAAVGHPDMVEFVKATKGARTFPELESPCQSPAMTNGRCRMHGGMSPGPPKANKNALKHGRFTADAIANRREIAMLLRVMKALARTTDEGD